MTRRGLFHGYDDGAPPPGERWPADPDPTRERPLPGLAWLWEPVDTELWQLAEDGQLCQRQGPGNRHCLRPAVVLWAYTRRVPDGTERTVWYGRCERHLEGQRLEGVRLLEARQRPDLNRQQ